MDEMFEIGELIGEKFENLEQKIFRYVCDMGVQMTVFILEQLDSCLMHNRDKKRYKSKQVRKTVIKTVYGSVEYNRRMYYDRQKDEYVYLLDDNMQMEKIGTISSNLAKRIADAAVNMPYRNAAETISETTGQSISGHGAWNVVQKIGNIVQKDEGKILTEMKTEQPQGMEESKILFMEADGVYLKIQKDKKKAKSQELKMFTIYSGWSNDGKKLVGKKVMAGMEPAEKFNEKTEALVQSIYNIDKTELRVLNGDGAAWISNTYDPDRIFQLDRFHILKKIRTCITEKHIQKMIVSKFLENKFDEMLDDINTYINSIEGSSDKQKIKYAKDLYSYLSNNYDGLEPWQLQAGEVPTAPKGVTYKNMGVQENQNCSLVCMRMKGRKMRWSVAGANNLAKLIYTTENGDIDRIIDSVDGQILIPQNLDFTDVLSADQVATKVGSGNKWMSSIQRSVPVTSSANCAYGKVLRQISH